MPTRPPLAIALVGLGLALGASPTRAQPDGDDGRAPERAAAPPDLSGRWAQLQVITSVERIPVLGTVQTTMGALLLLDLEQRGERLTGRETLCHLSFRSDSRAIEIEVPPAFTRALSGNQRRGRVVRRGGGWGFELERAIMLSGAALRDPDRDPLPTEPDDPRVRDSDGDSKPGVTLRSTGLVKGDIYLVQRSWNELEGQVDRSAAGALRVKGWLRWGSERRVLDADSLLLELEAESAPHPDRNQSVFAMVQVGPEDDCRAVAQRSRTLFRGDPSRLVESTSRALGCSRPGAGRPRDSWVFEEAWPYRAGTRALRDVLEPRTRGGELRIAQPCGVDMLSKEEVLALLADLESDRVERTESTNNTDKFSRAVCAFANDLPGHGKPGVLIIGARNNGTLAGTQVTDQLLQKLGGLRSDGNILPLPSLRVQRLALDGGEVAVVEVDPSDLPPVRYKGRVCIRVGPRRGDANEQEERILSERRTARAATFDVHPVVGAALEDLSLRLFDDYRASVVSPDVVAENHRTVVEQLASLRFFDLARGVPTVAGLLVFGANPLYHLPGASVMFLHFPGDEIADRPDDELSVSGDLQTVVETVVQKAKAYNRTSPAAGDGFRERTVADYPETALRELFLNAVIHRDYQSNSPVRFYWFRDRIEIQNPGGLYGIVTADTIEKRNDYRNPVIAEAMKTLAYVNRFGYGIQRAQAALAHNGNPPAEFDIDDRAFSVVIRRRSP